MRLQDLRPRYRYEKLLREEGYGGDVDKMMNAPIMKPSSSLSSSSSSSSPRRRCFWVKKMNGKKLTKGVKISRSRKVSWKRFSSFLLFPRKIAKIYNEVVKRLIELDGSSIMFATTWGIPVLSN